MRHPFSVTGRLRLPRWRLWVPTAAFLAGCGVLAGLLQGASRPTFNHFEHAEKGAECKDCHGEKLEAEAPVIPKMSVCMDCHEDLDKDQADPQKKASIFLKKNGNQKIFIAATTPKILL